MAPPADKAIFDRSKILEEMRRAMKVKTGPDPKSLFYRHMMDALKYGGLDMAKGGVGSGQTANVAQAVMKPSKFTESHMRRMLASRMGWDLDPAADPPLEFYTRRLNDGEAVVFVIVRGEPVTLRDDINLYPSDALVTSLRLLLA